MKTLYNKEEVKSWIQNIKNRAKRKRQHLTNCSLQAKRAKMKLIQKKTGHHGRSMSQAMIKAHAVA